MGIDDYVTERSHDEHHARFTSIKTYHEYVLKEMMGERQNLVYNAIYELNERGIFPTDFEIARHLNFSDPNSVRPRRFELAANGWIVEAGKKYCSITGRLALTWKAPRLEQLFDIINENELHQYKYLEPKKWDALRKVMERDGFHYEGNGIWKKYPSVKMQ